MDETSSRSPGIRLVCALLAAVACADPPTPEGEIHLPVEWRNARVDRERGGRFLPEANRQLRAFQERVLREETPVLLPQYDRPATVVFATSPELPQTERRLEILLEHEAGDPESEVLILSDRPPEEVVDRWDLDSRPWAGRVDVVRMPEGYAGNSGFPFVRDYAPLIRVRPTRDGNLVDAVATFRGSTLTQVLDPARGTFSERSHATLAARFEATQTLADAYATRLGPGVRTVHLDVRMDGGNLLGDGRGGCFATDVLIAKNGGDRRRVAEELGQKLGCRRMFFLASPQRLDRAQHVDTLLAFADGENAILSMPTLYESDLAAEYDNVETLLRAGYKVHRVPRKTASITYTNLLVTRGKVYVPQYSVYAVESPQKRAAGFRNGPGARHRADVETITAFGGAELRRDNAVALEVVSRLFPDREAVPVDSDETIHTAGSWHCLSHELPAAAAP